MKPNILFIINPNSGKGNVDKKIKRLIVNFERMGYSINTVYTEKDKPILKKVNQYLENTDIIVCCGGDGTLNEIINIIMELDIKIKLSFIPLGTMNDFSKTIKISRRQIFSKKNNKGLKVATSDIGKFNDKYFNYVAAFGAFTEVSYATPQKLKNIFGKMAYFLRAVRDLFKIKEYNIKVEFDGNIEKGKFLYGAVSNSRFVGGIKWYRKTEVVLDDGKFEMLLIRKPKNILQLMKILVCLLKKKYNNPYFVYSKVNNAKFSMAESTKWTIDGEDIGETKEVEIQNVYKRIEYVIPYNKK